MSNCIILSGSHTANINWGVVDRALGQYRVASALQDAGYTTYVLDFINKFSIDELIDVLKDRIGPDTLWIGFSSTFFSKGSNPKSDDSTISLTKMYWGPEDEDLNKFFNFIRQYKNVKIIYGGSKTPYLMMDSNIDYYVLGYADVAIVDLTNYLAGKKQTIDHVEEITTIDGNTSYKIESQKYPEPDINNISTYWWDKSFDILPGETLPIELARGCIFKCKFCSYPLLGKKKGTYTRSASQIRDELIKMYEVHGTTGYYITDDTFNDDNDKIEELHKVFTSLPFKPHFVCFLRVDLLNRFPHQAELLAEMGLIGTFLGIETLNYQSGKAIGKGLHPNKVKDRLYQLNEAWKNKVNISAGFIIGLPYDTHEYFYDLISWCLEKDNPIHDIQFNPLHIINPNDYSIDKQLLLKKMNYVSEFSLNADIYGYNFDSNSEWSLPSQKLNSVECKNISNIFNELATSRNKIGSFVMCSLLNIGVKLEDLLNLTHQQIEQKYNIPALAKNHIDEYKKLIKK